VLFAAGSLAAGLLTAPAAAQAPPRAPAGAAEAFSNSLEATARLVAPSVVEIFTTAYTAGLGVVPSSADLVTTQRGSGSGVIVSPDGFIVTNAHVVRGAQHVRVEIRESMPGGSILDTRARTLAGQVVGLDLETDLAVIKVDARDLPALAFGDSDALKPGQMVLAVGNPLGLERSVSLGVVSAVARQLQPESPMIYVQTDASINPGSSGGPLVDVLGRLVGLNTLILSQAGGSDGLSFSAPSNIVRAVYEQIRQFGRVRRGDIGVRAQTVTPVLASGLGLPRDYGAILADVAPRSAAEAAGLRPGDLVLSVDGKPIENGRQLHVTLYRHAAGDIVALEILRDGVTAKVPVALSEREDPMANLSASADPRQNLVPRLGILGLDLDDRIRPMVPVVRVPSGVVVASTVAGAVDARDGGLAAGDVIYAVNRTPVGGLDAIRAALATLRPGDPVVLQLERRGELMYLAFTIE
jgi:serine protease Do